ncbi:MAG: DNA mismatch repair protein MutS, partial [Halocynthiibacter sp.]
SSFDSVSAEKRLLALFDARSLDAFGAFSRAELSALGATTDYLDMTQKGKLPLLLRPRRETAGGVMQIDAATRRNLEITRALSGGREGSLIAAIDRTVTPAGARLLEHRISSPVLDLAVIHARQDAVAFLCDTAPSVAALPAALRDALRRTPDMARALSRLALDRAGPRDLAAVRNGLSEARLIAGLLRDQADLPALLQADGAAMAGHDALISLLEAALIAEPPLLRRDGGFIAETYDKELDQVRQLRDQGRGVIARLQKEYADETEIASLKIKHNNVLGYFIETPAARGAKLLAEPLAQRFIHRQSTATAARFTTVELSELETRILNAGGRALEIEKRLYDTLKEAVLDRSDEIHDAARALAQIDLTAGFADLAVGEAWCRPVVDDSRAFEVSSGRHPVVEMALRRESGASFVANSCRFSPDGGASIWLLTGPNMAGKSTYLRQNALITLLAQSGSFVPARAAHIGLVSQLFSRVGASDDLARGRATFMVEMVETAAILNQADDRALVILDEIGRGTATYDGLSIAWATLEHLHDVNGCRALFATHYHEMTDLANTLAGVENATVAVKEWEGEVIFLHEVREGAADRSYGVQVARLAGLPDSVIARARALLDVLEKGEREGRGGRKALIDDLPLFAVAPAPAASQAAIPAPALKLLESIQPDLLTAKEALVLIYQLKGLGSEG